MPDVYATIAEADPAIVERLANALEIRAAEPAQGAMREAYLAEVPFPDRSRVLEIGCGTGPVARYIAGLPQVAVIIGIDPSPILLKHARRLSEGLSTLSFQDADGRELPFPDDDFDVVVGYTVLCHVPNPQDVLAEARRVLRPDGYLAIFDGDYSTTSVAIGENDPLQACVNQAVDSLVTIHGCAPVVEARRIVRLSGDLIPKSRLRANARADLSLDPCRPWRGPARGRWPRWVRPDRSAQGRSPATSRGRSVLRPDRFCESHRRTSGLN